MNRSEKIIPYTQLKNTGRKVLTQVIPLRKPFTVLIEPSSLCNFRCLQCFQRLGGENYFTRTRMNMPMERFEKVLSQLKSWKGEKIKVLKLSLYGEPLMNPDFCEMVRLAVSSGVAERVETTSNVSLLDREKARALVEAGLDYLRVSVYGAQEENHRRVTNSSFTPARIRENLLVLLEERKKRNSLKPFVGAKMLDSFQEENARFLEFFRDAADELYLDKPHTWIKVAGSDFLGEYYGKEREKAERMMEEDDNSSHVCPMAFTTMAVRANGDVSPCCVDFIGGTNLGNMEEKTLQELWEGEEFLSFQKLQLERRKKENSSCAKCDICRSAHYTRDNIDSFSVEQLLEGRKKLNWKNGDKSHA